MRGFGVIEMAIIVPLAAVFLRPAPDQSHASSGAFLDPEPGPVLGWPPNLVFFMLCAAAFLCCMPMALPQTHLVAFCSDLDISPSHGAACFRWCSAADSFAGNCGDGFPTARAAS